MTVSRVKGGGASNNVTVMQPALERSCVPPGPGWCREVSWSQALSRENLTKQSVGVWGRECVYRKGTACVKALRRKYTWTSRLGCRKLSAGFTQLGK